MAAIAQLVAHFRSTAVLCTATQPALEAQFRAFVPALPIQELCPGTSDLYEHFRRVTFARAGRLSREALAERLAAQPQALQTQKANSLPLQAGAASAVPGFGSSLR